MTEVKEQPKNEEQNLTVLPSTGVFDSIVSFNNAQRMSTALSQSEFVPKAYQKNIPNCMVALEMAYRMEVSVILVMQNMNVISGSPGWKSEYVIACVNSSGKFSPMRWKFEDLEQNKTVEYTYKVWNGQGFDKKTGTEVINDRSCVAYCKDLDNGGEILFSTPITLEMAVKEGWYSREGSKWKTMQDQMMQYRAATFFTRLYIPQVLKGMKTVDEILDIVPEGTTTILKSDIETINDKIKKTKGKKKGEMSHGTKPEPAAKSTASEPAKNESKDDDML